MNVSGVKAIIKIFILSKGLVYNLLLSKKWMYRVCAIKDHGTGSFTIEGKDRICHLVKKTTARPELMEIVNGLLIDEWETNLAKEELICLSEELDNTDYENNSAKNLHQ